MTARATPHARQRFLIDADAAAAFRDEIQQPMASVFLATVVVLLALALAALRRPGSVWATAASWWAAVTLGFLPSAYLARAVPFHHVGVAAYWAWIALASVALAAGARAVGPRRPADPAIALLGLTVVVLGADVVLGSPLQFNGAFGYSPEVAGRFIGFGNAGFAIFGASALFLACLIAARGGRGTRVIALAILLGAVLLDGAPMWGADVGGVLALVPAFGLVAVRLLGWRIRPRAVLLALGGTAVAVLGAVAIDLSRPPDSRTHLGRLVEQVQREGPGEFVDVVTRKIGLNLSSFGSSPFRWLLPVVILGGLAAVVDAGAGGPHGVACAGPDPRARGRFRRARRARVRAQRHRHPRPRADGRRGDRHRRARGRPPRAGDEVPSRSPGGRCHALRDRPDRPRRRRPHHGDADVAA